MYTKILSNVASMFYTNRHATSRDFEAWLRTIHGLEPEALPEPIVVQPEVTIAQPVVDTVVDPTLAESDTLADQLFSSFTPDEQYILKTQLGLIQFNPDSPELPSGCTGRSTYYRKLKLLRTKLNSSI